MKVVAKITAQSAKGWFEEGEVLTVLSVSAAPLGYVNFLIWSSLQKVAALFPSQDFEVINNSLSHYWAVSLNSQGYFYLAPEAWQIDGFWEKYNDGDPIAEQEFMRELALLLNE